MCHIDVDTHVMECDATWEHLAKNEQHWCPVKVDTDGSQKDWTGAKALWSFNGQTITRSVPGPQPEGVPPYEVRTLEDSSARLEWMDRLNTDVQVIYSSFFLAIVFENPAAQIALTRSYNRWMADRCSGSDGRLKWSLVPPLLDIPATIKEIQWGAENGAASVLMRAIELKRILSDPYFYPVYEVAQDCDLAIGIHIGNAHSPVYTNLNAVMFAVTAMAGAFTTIFDSDFSERFPKLRFGFLEGGSEWLPFALREIRRGVVGGFRRIVDVNEKALSGTNLFIACTFDEDLQHVLKFAGPDNLVLGSDFGHSDFGTDMGAHHQLVQRTDLDGNTIHAICNTNGRRLYGLPMTEKIDEAAV